MSMPVDDAGAGAGELLSASTIAYQAISEAIITGVYPEGQFLDEASLARSVGTSRTPVREALRRLHSERYVDLVPRRGAQVRVTTATEMQEIYETRLIIESAAMTRICRLRRGAPPKAASILEALAKAGAREEWFTFARLDQSFHESIVEHGGNGVLTELYSAMRPRHIRLAVRTITEAPGRREIIEQEHVQIVDYLEVHDESGAIQILNQHLRSVPEVLQAFVR